MNSATNPPAKKMQRSISENRRRGNRHRLDIPATLVLIGNDPVPIEVTVFELAVSGLGLRCKQELVAEGTYQLSSFDTLIPPNMRVHIVSQRKLNDGTMEVGAKAIAPV